jgi:hypothetical protein
MWHFLLAILFPCCVCSFRIPFIKSSTSDLLPCCQLNWTSRTEEIKNVRKEIKSRRKIFLRFHTPVFHLNSNRTWQHSRDEFDTWVWVPQTHNYMLKLPHNFDVLSLGMMKVVTKDFEISNDKVTIVGNCSRSFLDSRGAPKPRCGFASKDIMEFMSNVTVNMLNLEWKYVCRQVRHGGCFPPSFH